MTSLGTVHNQMRQQTFKCEKCRRNFGDIWLPGKACCRLAAQTNIQYIIGRVSATPRTPRPFRRCVSAPPVLLERRCNSAPVSITRPPSEERRRPYTSSGVISFKDLRPQDARNQLSPFFTLGKPTCGFHFSRGTENRKRDFGIPPTNTQLWRSERQQNNQSKKEPNWKFI